jgi:hypothetical protein
VKYIRRSFPVELHDLLGTDFKSAVACGRRNVKRLFGVDGDYYRFIDVDRAANDLTGDGAGPRVTTFGVEEFGCDDWNLLDERPSATLCVSQPALDPARLSIVY